MTDEEPNFVNKNNKRIFCRYWGNEDANEKPRALVFLCHGAAEHSGYYGVIAEPLAKEGLFPFAHDHVGHGKSDGDRCHIEDVQDYVDDVLQHIDIVKKKYPDLPVYIIGHSMGGLISLQAYLKQPDLFSGVLLIGPAVIPNPETVTKWKVMIARALAYMMPQFKISPIESQWVSRDPEIRKQIEEDPLNYREGLKTRWSVAMLDSMEHLQEHLAKINCPLLVLHGEDDKLCEIAGSKILHQLASSKDKTYKTFPNAYHQLHYEPDGVKEETINMIKEWIVTRL